MYLVHYIPLSFISLVYVFDLMQQQLRVALIFYFKEICNFDWFALHIILDCSLHQLKGSVFLTAVGTSYRCLVKWRTVLLKFTNLLYFFACVRNISVVVCKIDVQLKLKFKSNFLKRFLRT